jgi:hypothetical protein
MIVFVTTRGHGYTVKSLTNGTFGPALPPVRVMAWEDIFHARRLPRGTYVFTDMERLSAAELELAARLYGAAVGAGLRCLNDPARVRFRYALLYALHAAGMNPFMVYRAEALPRPARFPVFVRGEAGHGLPLTGLLPDQAALEAHLAALQANGTSLRSLLVIEFCAEPIASGAWRRNGTFRIGPAMHFDHAVIENNWLVKSGTFGLATAEMARAERDAVAANEGAEALRPVFELAGIDYGRADHATVGGRQVVYEINTNPNIYPLAKQRLPERDEAQAIARGRFAALLAAIDTQEGGEVQIVPASPPAWQRRFFPLARRLGFMDEPVRPV